jgi:hypothetical protein
MYFISVSEIYLCSCRLSKDVVKIDQTCARDRGYHCLFVLMYRASIQADAIGPSNQTPIKAG